MSSAAKSGVLPPFSAAAAQAAVEASTETYPAEYIVSVLLEISGYLVSLEEQTTLLGRTNNDPYSPSLRILHSRLHNGHLNPSPIQTHANEHLRIKAALGQRTNKDATQRPLEDFEDMYYAILARMQDIHQILNARLGSGFSTFTDLIHSDGPSIADLYVSLAQYWDALNQVAFVKPIDCAVRRSRVKYLHQEIVAQVHNDEITHADAEELLNDLYDPREYEGIQGLAWISGWAPSMVAAWLEEKYRNVLKVEKEAAESKGRMDRKRAKMGKKAQQPKHELRSRKEGKRVVDEEQMASRGAKLTGAVVQQPREQLVSEPENQQDELQYALEWQIKAQRVSEYSQYLRSMASHDIRHLMESNNADNMRMNGVGGPVQSTSGEDAEMTGSEF